MGKTTFFTVLTSCVVSRVLPKILAVNFRSPVTRSRNFPVKTLDFYPFRESWLSVSRKGTKGTSMSRRRAWAIALMVVRPRVKMPPYKNWRGEVREWTNRHAWKACVPAMGPWVRIPPSPPLKEVLSSELSVLSYMIKRTRHSFHS